HRRAGARRRGDRSPRPPPPADLQHSRGPLGCDRARRPRGGRPADPQARGVAVDALVARRIDALYLRAIQLVLVGIQLNLAFASSINNSFLLLGRAFRFSLLFELAVVAGAYRTWRRPRARPVGVAFLLVGVFVALAMVSSLWSVDPHHTETRAGALLI